MATQITMKNFDDMVLHSDKPVLLDFWAPWCMPCRMLSPVIDELADELPGVTVGKINIDDEPELASQFGVMTIPTLVVMEQGKVVTTSVGVKPKNAILDMLKIHI